MPELDATRLTRLRRLGEAVPSPDGTWLAVTVKRLDDDESKYVSDLWRVPLQGGAPRRLTRGPSNDHTPRFRRDDALGFASNRNPRDGAAEAGDDQRDQVWLLPAEGGEPHPITDEPLGVSDFAFARDTDRLAVIADVLPGVPDHEQRARAAELADEGPSGLHYTQRPVRHWDHWLPAAAPHLIDYGTDGVRRDLTPQADREHREIDFGVEWDLAPDGSRAVLTCQRPGAGGVEDVALRLVELDGGHTTDLGVVERCMFGEPRFAPDSRRIACVRDVHEPGRAMRPHLWLFDDGDTDGRPLADDWDAWPSPQAWTSEGDGLVCTADARGRVPVYLVDVGSGEVSRITDEGAGGSHGSVHVTGEGKDATVVGLRHRIVHPPEPFSCPLRPGSTPTLVAELSGWTGADGDRLVAIDELEVDSDDGFSVHSFVVTPRGAEGPLPALLWIHGGPMGQHADGWHWRWNALVAAADGYAVALPNPRGSTGYGQECVDGIWNNAWGGACYRDLMRVTDALARREDVDGERLGAMGGSFGGYMANWIGVNTDRFRCLMSHAGIYWLPAFYGTTDHPGFFAWEIGADPYSAPDEFARYSPHRKLDDWTTPTLIIHGERDYRVPVSEALMLFEGLRLRDVDAELLVFPDENHWILRPRNARQWYESVLAFAAKHLKSD